MNLKVVRPINQTEDLLVLITKICETLIYQTHTRPQETLDFALTESRKKFHFRPPISLEGSWMLGLSSLEIHNSVLNITEESNKFEL